MIWITQPWTQAAIGSSDNQIADMDFPKIASHDDQPRKNHKKYMPKIVRKKQQRKRKLSTCDADKMTTRKIDKVLRYVENGAGAVQRVKLEMSHVAEKVLTPIVDNVDNDMIFSQGWIIFSSKWIAEEWTTSTTTGGLEKMSSEK